jgi:hypothetical protein
MRRDPQNRVGLFGRNSGAAGKCRGGFGMRGREPGGREYSEYSDMD